MIAGRDKRMSRPLSERISGHIKRYIGWYFYLLVFIPVASYFAGGFENLCFGFCGDWE